ncbi:MAG: threonine synthase [Spirochaetaceae bacterium]|jgi:threonine synthase|nr:threonine synthase [Spirochaetaceae bacterium]
MRFYSTRNRNESYGFAEAVIRGLAPDGGLFVPEEIPRLPPGVISSLGSISLRDVAYETVRPFVASDIPGPKLEDIVNEAFNFDAPLVPVGEPSPSGEGGRFVLELFHGPTAAFKDFGARFMARAFAYLRRNESRPLKILTATSGDTGGAVASGFYRVEGIDITVLYPKGRVTALQERQIAGLGCNIKAIEVEGSFDDCQRLVKAALSDGELNKRLVMSSANSINIARLVPQAVYYASAAGVLKRRGGAAPAVFCVPSGNLGNLTAGMYAAKMGAPVDLFIAAANSNRTFTEYLSGGAYRPRESIATISNAMDVGAPSNFERLSSQWTADELRRLIVGVSVSDDDTRAAIAAVHRDYGYVLDPHGAVGWQAVSRLRGGGLPGDALYTVLATAHPAKFAHVVEPLVGPVKPPPCLEEAMAKTVHSISIAPEFNELKAVL